MLRVIAIMSGNQDEAGELRMHELAMAALAAMDPRESTPFKVGN